MRTANLDKHGLGLFHNSTSPARLVEINMNHQDAKPPKDPLAALCPLIPWCLGGETSCPSPGLRPSTFFLTNALLRGSLSSCHT